MTTLIPTEVDAKRIVAEALNLQVQTINRFPTGLAHYVFDVTTQDDQHIVVRLAREDLVTYFEGALHWYDLLKPKGVPLPKFIYTELSSKKHGFPVIIMKRLPGTDLGQVYTNLSTIQKKLLTKKIVDIQNIAGSLPLGKGFGYATSNDSFMGRPLQGSWLVHLENQLERSRKRIAQAGIFDETLVTEIKKLIDSHATYFDKIEAKCFIDDTTTKNVIINDGALSGVVDVDSICFGDMLEVPALTKMSLINKGYETDYIDYWLDELNLNIDQTKAFNIYLAMYCYNFMSEFGHSFNKEKAEEISEDRIEWFKNLFNHLVSSTA